MSELSMFLVGFLFGLLTTLVIVQRHVRRMILLMDELLEDEIVAPLRKTDAARAYRFQNLYRELLKQFERLI